MNNYVLYLHKNKINGKMYIGITNNIKTRWKNKGSQYKKSKSFYNAILKYGFDNFEHIILLENLTFDNACKLEKEYIKKYDTRNKLKGYNIAEGGNGGKIYFEHPRNMLGKKQTEYQKQHQKEWASVKKNNCMTNGSVIWGKTHNHPKGMSGKSHTKEHNKRVSELMKKNKVNCKGIKIIYPNGKVEEYDGIRKASKIIGLSQPVISKLLKNQISFEIKVINQYTNKVKHLEGIKIIPR